MVDKVSPLKYESSSTGGTENDFIPTEANPLEDYLAGKGISFEKSDDFLLDKVGRVLVEKFPSLYQSPTYSSGNLTVLEFFNSSSFITANRVCRYDFTYNGDSTLATEVLVVYDTNGTTILRTYTWTHTYVSQDLSSSGLVIT